MSHQCVHCSEIYPDAAKELLSGCKCGSHFFFYLKKEQLDALKGEDVLKELSLGDKEVIEHDVREIMGVEDEEIPIVLDLESIHIVGPGKFEIDIVNLFRKNRPLIYKLEEGKYIIDIASSFRQNLAISKEK